MELRTRTSLLRANALFLLLAGSLAMINDLRGAFLGTGPVAAVLAGAPHVAIGFVEAHGLAIIVGAMLWRARAERGWHLAAAAVHLLLGVSNVVFWDLFGAAGMVAVGWITTVLHFAFFALQATAAARPRGAP